MDELMQQLMTEVKSLREAVAKFNETRDPIAKAQAAVLTQEVVKTQKEIKRKAEFNTAIHIVGSEKYPTLPEHLQQKADDIYLVSKLLHSDPRGLKMWGEFAQEASEFRKAMDTATATEGAEWIPTGFSAELIQKVKLALKVAALHGRIVMPTNPFKLPMDGADAVAYLTGESTSDTATKITASTPGSTNMTFNAIKLACRILVSTELEEDSIVAILPLLRDKIVTALAEAQEDCTINGDTSTSHQDSDVTGATDRRKAWKGYRKHALAAAKVDLSTFSTANLRAIRKAMGKYGVNPNSLAWIAGISDFHKILSLTEVLTVDKYGANATILTGELAKFDGIPVIVSEFIRENLNASGVYDGSTTTKTVLPLVFRPAFLYGDRRAITLKVSTELYMETDQDVAVATQRLDFQPVQDVTTEKVVGLGYNITS